MDHFVSKPHSGIRLIPLSDGLRQALAYLAEATYQLETLELRIRRAEALVAQHLRLTSEDEDEAADEAG